jgi:preprotein translocase subunit SecE
LLVEGVGLVFGVAAPHMGRGDGIQAQRGAAMAKMNPVEFLRDVRDESRKVTWPARRELVVSTIMVLIMVVLASLFFLGVDAILKYVVDGVLFGF